MADGLESERGAGDAMVVDDNDNVSATSAAAAAAADAAASATSPTESPAANPVDADADADADADPSPAPPQPPSVPEPPPPSDLPLTFPKKRRGRPPGRPNMTVRESDYEDNILVKAWNAAKSDHSVPAVGINIRAALIARGLVHETQREIFQLPSREIIYFVQGWITARHIASQRPSYINGLLIHSRGNDAPTSCAQCVERHDKNALGPFLTCRILPGYYHNSCSNCKWFDNTSVCSLYTGPKPNRKRKANDATSGREAPAPISAPKHDGEGVEGRAATGQASEADADAEADRESTAENSVDPAPIGQGDAATATVASEAPSAATD
jgi:hypothetical protein